MTQSSTPIARLGRQAIGYMASDGSPCTSTQSGGPDRTSSVHHFGGSMSLNRNRGKAAERAVALVLGGKRVGS